MGGDRGIEAGQYKFSRAQLCPEGTAVGGGGYRRGEQGKNVPDPKGGLALVVFLFAYNSTDFGACAGGADLGPLEKKIIAGQIFLESCGGWV